jgi:RNA polymerase sigma-70 factor (ECF subfamily)
MMDRLVEQARAGGQSAFEALVRRHDRRVLALALRLTGRLEDAQEVAQESYSRLYRNLNRFRSDDEVWPWLRMVTVNLCRDLGRRKARSPVVEGLNTAEVAEIMGIAAATVRVQIMQARLKLRKLLEKQLGRVSK